MTQQPQTRRRMARMTTKKTETSMPYVAVRVEHVAAETMIIPCTARVAMTIKGVNGGKARIDAGEKFYLYRSASLGKDMFYIVRLVDGKPTCSCMAAKPCKHETGVAEREENQEQPMSAALKTPTLTSASPVMVVEAVKEVPLHERGNLGRSGGFLDQMFGRSPSMAKYRQEYIDARAS